MTGDLLEQVYACVADAYETWGTATHQASLLGELAEDLVTDVLETGRTGYVAVTALLQGTQATISAIPALAPAPAFSYPLPYREAPTIMPPSWGRIDLATGRCAHANVSLMVFNRRRDR